MATPDISRSAFDPRKHYTSVRMQQGRVLTDDDWNENERIDSESDRRLLQDVVGTGTPDDGFRITNIRSTGGTLDFEIGSGSYYLGGVQLEAELSEPYRVQADWLQQQIEEQRPRNGQVDLVYLEAWQQHVSAVEDNELFEVGLGGPDTTTRVRNMRRVRVQRDVKAASCPDAWTNAGKAFAERGEGMPSETGELDTNVRLTVSLAPGDSSADPCEPSFAGGYLGAENQSIRVQLVSETTFTWGFDNAAPLYRVKLSPDGATVTFETDPKDQAHWPLAGDVVEILPWSAVLINGEKLASMRGHLTAASSSYDPDARTIGLASSVPSGFGAAWKGRPDAASLGEEYFYLRVWQRGADRTTPAEIAFTPGTPVALGHTGLLVTFTGAPPRPGDHWVIAARPNSPDQVVPWELLVGRAPSGVRRFRTPLALVRWSVRGRNAIPTLIADCRRHFLPLTEVGTCATYTVGDGTHSHGHFSSIQAAIDALPLQGGEVHVLPGEYREHVLIARRTDVVVRGCGPRTRVIAQEGSADPVFRVRDSQRVKIDSLSVATDLGVGVELEHSGGDAGPDKPVIEARAVSIKETLARDTQRRVAERGGRFTIMDFERATEGRLRGVDIIRPVEEFVPSFDISPDAIELPRPLGIREIAINEVAFRVRDRSAILGRGGSGVSVTRCVIDVRPLADDLGEESDAGRWPAVFLTTDDVAIEDSTISTSGVGARRTAFGGVQIGGGSDRVRVQRNTITGGNGNGITLGSVLYVKAPQRDLPFTDYARFLDIGRIYPIGLTINVDARGCVVWSPVPIPPVDDEGEDLVPASEGSLSDVYLVDNRIVGTGGSGVAVAQFFDPTETLDCVSVSNLTIRGNSITECLRGEIADVPVSIRSFSAYGGVALGGVFGLQIANNHIADNGLSHVDPICGVFLLYGEDVLIEHNRITNNGPRTDSDATPRVGNRGGIVVAFAATSGTSDEGETFRLSVYPAARIHHNVVVVPEGRALLMNALGEVSVQQNHFVTQGHGTRRSHGMFNEAAAGRLAMTMSLRATAGSGLALAVADATAGGVVSITNHGTAFEFLQRAGRALSAADTEARLEEEHSAREAAVANEAPVEKTAESAKETGATHSVSRETDRITPSSQREGGNIIFSGNQVSISLAPGDVDPPSSAVLLMSGDDISMQDNQVDAMVPPTLWFVNGLVYGTTIRVLGNRFKEPLVSPNDQVLSGLTIGRVANVTSTNEGTHCFYAYAGRRDMTVRVGNISLVEMLEEGACAYLGEMDLTMGKATAGLRFTKGQTRYVGGESGSASADESSQDILELLR